jgi:signal transduction histidine kinase
MLSCGFRSKMVHARHQALPARKLWGGASDGRGRTGHDCEPARLLAMIELDPLDKSYEGTGIGLAPVRRIVERMGGRAGVQSEPGRGSRFWVELKAVVS